MDFLKWLRGQWDRVSGMTAMFLGAVFLLVGWFGISDEVVPAGQLPYLLSGGIGGIFLLGVGATLWLSADLRDEWREVRRVRAALERLEAPPTRGAESPSPTDPIAQEPRSELANGSKSDARRPRVIAR
jgi:hypothetical protein